MNKDKKSDKDQKSQQLDLADKSYALADGIEIGSILGSTILNNANIDNSIISPKPSNSDEIHKDELDSD